MCPARMEYAVGAACYAIANWNGTFFCRCVVLVLCVCGGYECVPLLVVHTMKPKHSCTNVSCVLFFIALTLSFQLSISVAVVD